MYSQDNSNYHKRFSKNASDASRQLSFAGIALIWIFRIQGEASPSIPQDLLYSALLLSAALAFDLLHYIVGTLIWYNFYRYHEGLNVTEEDKLHVPVILTYPIIACFWLKLILVIVAYAILINYMYILVVTS